MKSLLQFLLMISLVVAGKFTRQAEVARNESISVPATWQVPVRGASLLHAPTIEKRKTKPAGRSYFWQAAAPSTVSSANIE